MEVKIDDYGRIVIPKEVRDHLGIESGRTLKISVKTEGVKGGAITQKDSDPRSDGRGRGASRALRRAC